MNVNGSNTKLQMAILVSKALLGLAFYDVLLWQESFAATLHRVHNWKISRESSQPETVSQICIALNIACTCYPKRVLCLQRAAVGTCLLREYGFPAKMVIGVRIMPLFAHAWVEVDGAVVNDLPRVQKYYDCLTCD